jgi:hypothetical protein
MTHCMVNEDDQKSMVTAGCYCYGMEISPDVYNFFTNKAS